MTTTDTSTIEPGTILECSWGYDQTNIDWYQVVKRTVSAKGTVTVTLQPMTSDKQATDQYMDRGQCVPGHVIEGAKTFRRKVHVWNGEERGVSINSYSWAGRWNGQPVYWSSYA